LGLDRCFAPVEGCSASALPAKIVNTVLTVD
jgi:hypothetical protein